MNRKLILKLSLWGLAMGFATISIIPQNIEPFIWLIIFLICAYSIAKKCSGKYFMHGFLVSVLNSVWITAIHILFFQTYMANHPDEISMMAKFPMPYSPRITTLLMGLPLGAAFGLILGLFSFIASNIVKRKKNNHD